MMKTMPHRTRDRCSLLKILSAGGYGLYEAALWLDYEEKVGAIRRPLEKVSAFSEQMPGLVRYAPLAASGHNAQP